MCVRLRDPGTGTSLNKPKRFPPERTPEELDYYQDDHNGGVDGTRAR